MKVYFASVVRAAWLAPTRAWPTWSRHSRPGNGKLVLSGFVDPMVTPPRTPSWPSCARSPCATRSRLLGVAEDKIELKTGRSDRRRHLGC